MSMLEFTFFVFYVFASLVNITDRANQTLIHSDKFKQNQAWDVALLFTKDNYLIIKLYCNLCWSREKNRPDESLCVT